MAKYRSNKKKKGSRPLQAPTTTLPAAAQGGWHRGLFYGIVAFLGALPWLHLSGIASALTMQFVVAALLVSAIAAVTVVGLLLGKLSWPSSRLLWIPAAYWLIVAFSCITSILPYHSIVGAYGFQVDGLLFLSLCMTLGFCLLTTKPGPAEIKLLLSVMAIQVSLLSLQTLFQAVQTAGGLHLGMRLTTPLYNSDFFLSYALMLLPIVVWQALRLLRARNRWAIAGFMGVLVVAAGIFFTMPETLQSLLVSPDNSGTTTASPSPTPSPQNPSPSPQPSNNFVTSTSNNQRYVLWKMGLEAGLKRPLLGWGPGTVKASFYQNPSIKTEWTDFDTYPNSYHNDFLDRFAESGILGVIAYAAVLIGLARLAYLNYRRYRSIAAALATALAFFLLFNQAIFTTVIPGLILWIFGACLLALSDKVSWRTLQFKPLHLVPAVLGGISLLGLVIFALNVQSAERSATLGFAYLQQRKDVGSAATYYQQASLTLPKEDTYSREAAANSFYAGISLQLAGQSSAQFQPYFQKATLSAAQAVQSYPYFPQNHLIQGIVSYVTSSPGTRQEQQGLEEIQAAKKNDSADLTIYEEIAQAFWLKNGRHPLTAAQTVLYLQDIPPAQLPNALQDISFIDASSQ